MRWIPKSETRFLLISMAKETKKCKVVGSGKLKVCIPYKKSPKGRNYIGKTTFVNKEFAKGRASDLNLDKKKKIAWVEERTVYSV